MKGGGKKKKREGDLAIITGLQSIGINGGGGGRPSKMGGRVFTERKQLKQERQ